MFNNGSSPLSRGILRLEERTIEGERIIPALAGNTLPHTVGPAPQRDHPRSRGEYFVAAPINAVIGGSSPLSRGIPRMTPSRCTCARIIPALAGNTAFHLQLDVWSRDHPRSRGEYGVPSRPVHLRHGSSPLSRGIPTRNGPYTIPTGIIPALAGNTPGPRIKFNELSDHPRSRGEYWPRPTVWRNGNGSSPLSRGIPAHRRHPGRRPGIIPALAGNTAKSGRKRTNCSDHPRSRGEYAPPQLRRSGVMGSSPLSRGIRTVKSHEPPHRGIIPALAGNTIHSELMRRFSRDHPRSRGEYTC